MGLKFSQRIGKTPVREALQVEGMDRGLENGLWNCIYAVLDKKLHKEQLLIYQQIWVHFSNKKINHFYIDDNIYSEYDDSCERNLHSLEKDYNSLEWFKKYDLIEFLVQNFNIDNLICFCNKTLEKHQSAYRIINNQVTPIISEIEIQTIETALENPSQAVTNHLDTALQLLSDRQNPDYRNSIKESISAVESYCLLLTNNSTTSMNKAMTLLKEKHGLNNVLEKAFKSLYGYTSTAGGIRHAMIDDQSKEITQAEARFMLISCSAFVNYLREMIGEE